MLVRGFMPTAFFNLWRWQLSMVDLLSMDTAVVKENTIKIVPYIFLKDLITFL